MAEVVIRFASEKPRRQKTSEYHFYVRNGTQAGYVLSLPPAKRSQWQNGGYESAIITIHKAMDAIRRGNTSVHVVKYVKTYHWLEESPEHHYQQVSSTSLQEWRSRLEKALGPYYFRAHMEGKTPYITLVTSSGLICFERDVDLHTAVVGLTAHLKLSTEGLQLEPLN